LNKQKITQGITTLTLITWFLYIFLSPFLRLIFKSYDSLLPIIEYSLIAEYIFLATIMILVIRDTITAYQFNKRLDEQWRQEPEIMLLRDVSVEAKELNHPIALDTKKQIEEFGFRRLGETELLDFVNYVFINEDDSVLAVIRPRTSGHVDVFFETLFADSFMLITGYKCLINMVVDGLQQHRIFNTSIEKTYTYHLSQLEMHRLKHGQPVPINTIEQTIQQGQEYSKRYFDLEISLVQRVCMFSLLFSTTMEIMLLIGIRGLLNSNPMLASLPMVTLLLLVYLATKVIPEVKPVEFNKPKSKRKRKIHIR
jgi:hypothetical protein